MRLIIPNNIFTTLFLLSINKNQRPEVLVKDSSLIVSELENDENSIGLIPSFDLIDNRELYVSSKLGLAFEGLLSNTYVYYLENNSEINKVFLRGDVSKNEVILSKIIFRERYNIEPEFSLDINESIDKGKNYLVTGSQNWNNNFYKMGVSFSEQISDILEFPYVNFLFASKNEKLLREFNKQFSNVTKSVIQSLESNLKKIDLNDDLNNFILKEIPSVYFDFTEAETEGLKELLQLAYYHQIFDDIFNIKFV